MTLQPLHELLVLSDSGVWGDEDVGDGISILRSTNFNADGTLDFSKLALRSIEERKKTTKLLEPGDILLEKSGGGPKQPVGRVCLFFGDSKPHSFGNFIARLRVGPRLLPEYLFFFLWYFHSMGMTSQYQKQTTGIRNLELKRFLAIQVPLCSLPEQRRIVDLLTRASGIVRLRREAAAKAAELIPALFIHHFGDPAINPMGWPVASLGDVIVRGPSNGLYKHKSAYGAGVPILRIDAFYDGVVRDLSTLKRLQVESVELQRFDLQENDIVINRVNSPEYLGKSALIPALPEPTVFESNMMRLTVDSERLLPRYVIALLQTGAARAHFLSNAKHAINQSSINQQDVKSLPVALPPLRLQQAFVVHASAMESILLQQTEALAKAQASFNALLAQAFSTSTHHAIPQE